MVGESAYNWFTNLFQSDDIASTDKRKKAYGDLNDIKYRAGRSNSVRRNQIKRKNINKYRNNSVPKRKTAQTSMSGNSNNKHRDPLWNKFVQSLKLIFSNDTENITNMRVACEDFSLLSNSPRHGNNHLNRNKIIRERIRQSRSFKKKLAERDYDRRQLEVLKRSSHDVTNGLVPTTSNSNNIQLNNDKIVLLERQNKRLRKEILQRESELRIFKERIKIYKR